MRHFRLTALLAALLAAAVLTACGSNPPPSADTTAAPETTVPETTAPAPAEIGLIVGGETPFTIVRAEAAEDEATLAQLKRIHTAFGEAGVTAKLGTDWVKRGTEPNAESYEILVGQTNHPESTEVLRGLKYRDYAVKLVGNKIVLAGHTAATQAKAVDHFVDFLKEKAVKGQDLVFSETDNYVSESNYMLDTVTLGGVSLTDCVITLPADSTYAAEDFARRLRDTIANRSGYLLTIAETAEGAAGAIAVTAGGDGWDASASGTTLTCRAGGAFAFDCLFTALEDTIRSAKDSLVLDTVSISGKIADLKDETITRARTIDGDVRILYHNIWGAEMHNRDDMQAELYREYLPDIIGLQEVNADRVRQAKGNLFTLLADEYTEVEVTATNPSRNNYVPILYRTAKFDVIDSGWHLYADGAGDQSKSVTWAVFRDKTTGKTFGMANTHFYWTGDEQGKAARLIDAAEIIEVVGAAQAKHNVPFIIGGDLNCRVSAEPQLMLRKAKWQNANQKATVYHSNSKGHHEYPTLDPLTNLYADAPMPSGDYSTAIDHIYTFGDGVEVRVFDTLLHRFAIDSSDHCPIYVDVKLD